MMELTSAHINLLVFVLGGFLTLIGWFGNYILNRVSAIQKELTEHKIEVSKNYVRIEYMDKFVERIERKLEKLFSHKGNEL
jgi:uncharacterized membrane protein YccF (DUF307 family)